MLTRRAFSVASSALALSFALGVGGCGPKSNDIVVGAFLSLSGSDATFGSDTRDGIELKVAEINAAGGIKGRKVKVLYEDDKSTVLESSQKVRQLIDRDKVVAVLGEVASSRSLAGGLIANTSKVPMVSPSSTALEVTQGREYVFRTCFTDDQQGQVAAKFVKNELKKSKVGIFYAAQDTYSSGLAASFRDTMKKLGGEIVADKGYQKGETSYRTYLTELKSASPEIIFVPNYYNEMVLIARQAKELGIAGNTFVGGDGWDSANLIEGAGKELEGAYFTNHYAPDMPSTNAKGFLDGYKAKHAGRDASSLAAMGYDAAGLLFDAIGRAPEPKPEMIKQALAATKGYQGATGTITIDENRNAKKPIVVVQIKGGHFTYAASVTAE